MEEFDNAIPPLGVEPGLPSNFEGSDAFQASIAPTNEPLISVTDTYAVPGVPVPSAFGSVAVDYDPSNPFDVAKQAMAKPITESDIAFQNSKEKYFQPGYQQTNFDRYYNDSDNFYKLGFNPVSNNEALYNQNRSWYQDLFRAAGGIPALGLSVVQSGYRSLADMATGDFSMTDETGAREFSQIMAERGSTRGGAAGFVSNLALQSGFVAGIAADYLATEALLTGAVALSDGMALPAALAASAAKTAGTIKSISALFDANAARQAYNTIKAMDVAAIGRGALNVAEATAKNIVPNTFKNVKSFITAESPVLGLANSVRGVADFVRDMKQISYATAEASMEGGGVKNDFIDKHINEYITENGVYPDQDRLNRIYEKASDAGFTTGLINAPLILLTNNITFDNLYKGRKRTLGKTASGIVEESKLSGRTLRFSEKTGQFETMGIRQSFAESVRGLKTPKTYLNFASSYFSKNLSEGLQEISQEIISGASTDYYERLYDTPEAGGVVAYLADAYDNLKDQASAQGIEVFASGFLMGGLTGISTAVANRAYGSTKNIIGKIAQAKNPEEYRKAYAEESARFDKIAVELNDAINNGNKVLALDIDNLLVQIKAGTDMVNARKSFDEKAFHDLKDIARFNSVYTALQTNKFDFLIQKLEDMKQMTGEELKEAFDLKDDVTDEEAKQVLDITIDRAGQIKDQYEQFSAFKNPYNPNTYKFADTPEAITGFINELQNHKAFEEARKTAVFSLHGLEQAKTRMADLTKQMSSIAGVGNLSYSDVTATLSIPSIDTEINLLTAEIDSSKDITDPALIEITNNKKKKLKALESLKTNLARIENINDPVEVRKTSYLKKAFTDYMKVLLDEKGTTLNPADLNEAYRIFTDYYALNYDKTNFNKVLSDLYDPNNFIKLAQRERTLIVARDKRRAEFFKKAFKKYAETSKIGIFLKSLAAGGFVIDLKYLKNLETNSFDELKELILTDPDIKFRDLNSNKLFGVEDARFQNIKAFVSEFEVKTKVEVKQTPSNTKPKEPSQFSTDTTEEEEEFGSEDIEDVSEFTQTIVRRAYDDYLKTLREADIPVSFEEFVTSKKAISIINAITELEGTYDAITETKPEFTEWLRTNARTPLIFDVLNKNNVTFSDIFIQQRDENQYVTTALEEGESVVSPGYNGVFITKLSGSIEGAEIGDIYFVKLNDGTNAINATNKPDELIPFEVDAYTSLEEAQKAQKGIGNYLAKNKKEFVFDNVPLVNGQIISDTKNNEYIVLSYPAEIAAGSNLKLKNVKTGAVLTTKSFTGFKLERAPIDKKEYASRFDSISVLDKAWGKRMEGESQKDATARLSNLLRDTPIEQLQKGLSIRFTNLNKSPQRYAYLKLEDQKENQSLGLFTDSYAIALVFNGEEIGYLPNPTSFQFLDVNGNPISYDRINADRVKQAFYLKNGRYNQAVANIKASYKNKVALLNYLKSKLGSSDSVEISYSDLKKVANVNIGLGSYEFLSRDEERPKLSELAYNTINNGIYVIDRKNKYKNGSIITVEGSPITDIDPDLLESTIKEVDDARYKSGYDTLLNYGRYVAVVKLPNGKVRFVELTTPELSSEELNTLAASIKERIELTKKENLDEEAKPLAQEYNDVWNEDNIGNKVFISLPLKDKGKFLDVYVSPNGSIVLDFVNKNSRTDKITRKRIINDPEFNTFSELLSLLNTAIKEHDADVKLPANKMDIILTGRSFKAALPMTIDTLQVLDMEASVGTNVVKDVSVYLDMLEPASDVQANPILPKVDDSVLDSALGNIDFSSAPTSPTSNPDLLRGVAPVNPPVVPVTEPTEKPKEPIQVSSADVLNKVLAAQQSIPQQIKQLQAELYDKMDEVDDELRDKRFAEKGEELTVAEKREIRTQAENSPEVLAIKGQIEVLSNSIGLKVVDAGYTESDITNLTEFLTWVQNNLPDFITVEDLNTLKNNLYNGSKTVGAFVSSLSNVAGNVEVNGTIYTSASSPFKYHEAFHAVFRLLLSDAQISRYLTIAKKELRDQLRKEGKSFSLAKEEMRLLNPLYAAMSESQLEERMYEEYLADKFEAWKINKKTETSHVNKSLFAKIVELIKKVFSRFGKNELNSLFDNIDAGKYRNSKVVTNRYTDSPFDISEPVLKAIKIGTDVIEDSTFAAEGEVNLIRVDKYLPEQEGTRLSASVAAIYNNKLKDADKQTNTEDLLDGILNDYKELYNPKLEQYIDLKSKEIAKLKEYRSIFSLIENREILKEAVREHLAILSIKETNEQDASDDIIDELGERGKQNYTEGAASVGGFGSLSKFLRSWISTITYQAADEFGNVQFLDGTPYIQSVDGSTVYNGILKAIAGTETIDEVLLKLNLYKDRNFESGKVIDEFFIQTGVTFDEEGNPDLSNVKNSYLFQSFTKGFGQYAIDYLFINKDLKKEIANIISANRKDSGKVQFDQWSQAYSNIYESKLTPESKAKAKLVLTKIKTAMAPTKKYTDDELIQVTNKLSVELMETLGISLSGMYLSYSIANNITTLTDQQIKLFKIYSNVTPITIEDIDALSDLVDTEENPFINVQYEITVDAETGEVTPETEVLEGGATTRLYNLAKANAIFDESVYATSWKNAEGQLVYVHQLPSYHLVKINEIKKAGGIEELLKDPFLANNYLLNDPNFLASLDLVTVKRIDGQKVSSLNETEDGDVIENKQLEVNRREGTTYGSFTPEEFIVSLLDLYSTGDVQERNKVKFGTSTHLIRVLEASSTGNVVNLPIIKAAAKASGKNTLTKQAENAMLGFVEQEYTRIQRVANGEFIDEIYDFNTGKMRGLTLFKTGKLISEDLKNELEAQAQENLPLTEKQKAQIKKEMTQSMLNDVNYLIDLLDEDNILQVEDGKVTKSALASFVTKGFTIKEKDKKKAKEDITKNSFFNLKNNDYRYNLLQIYVNDFINTTAINQLMHGDHAISFKDAVDEVKRAKGSNATGANIEAIITDERLGIKHAFKTAHIVTLSDPLFQAKYAGGKGEKANAQMWMTVKALRYTLFGLGKLSPIQAELLNKIENGETVTGDFFFGDSTQKGAVSFDAATNSIKLVYFDGQTYIKTSGFVLTKEFTSYGNKFQYALPGKEELHSLRNTLEAYEKDRETVSLAIPVSGSKGKKTNVASDVNSITDRNFIETSTKYWRLQLENPSNKVKITDTTQIKTILTAEQNDETIVNFMGTDISVGDLKKIYQNSSLNRVKVNYLEKRNAIFTLDSGLEEVKKSIAAGTVTPKLAAFQKYAIETLKSSAGDAQMIEFFELDEQGEPKYDLNSPITIDKFVELFLSYFSKGVLSEKVPGHAVALVSDYGVKQLKKVLELDENGQPKRWELIRVEEFKLNPSKYGTPKTQSDLENRTFNDLQVGDYYVDDLRHNVPEYDENGKITGYFTEFIMPAHFKELLSFIKPGDKIPDAVAKMFGVRIPSQDKHSAVALKLVDFMPVYYGSSAVFPQELIEISGADFDIDKLYIAIQEWLVENGKFIAYGSGTTKTEKFNQFVKYQFSKNKEFKKAYFEFYSALKKEKADELEALQELDIDISDSDYFDDYINQEEVTKAALQYLNLPSTADEYNTKIEKLGYEPYQGALNNIIVNARIALLNNTDMVTAKEGEIPKAFQVATVDPLINIVKSFTEQFPELKDQLEEGKYNIDTLLGKYYAFRNNKEGARNIGPAVNSLLVYSLLNTNNINIRKASSYTDETGETIELKTLRFKLNGKEFDTYGETKAYNPKTGEYDGKRIADILSALVSAMTDNAKERLAAKLNLNIDSLGVVANMVAQGVSLEDSLLFINQPAIRKFYKTLRTNKSSYATDAERKVSKNTIIKNLIEKYDVKEIPTNITTADLIAGIKRNTPEIQVYVLNSFKTLNLQSDTFMNVSAVLKVNKGLPKDLTEFDEIYDKAVDLGLEMTDKEFETSSIPFDIRSLLRNQNTTFGFNFTVYREIRSLTGSVMLNRTPVVNRMRDIVLANTEVNFRDRKNFKKSLDQNLISFFAIKAYLNILNKGGYKRALASLNNGMIYDQAASTLPENMDNVTDVVKKLRELSPNNYFANKFLFAITGANKSNKDGINKVDFNNWTKLSKLQLNKIQYSFMELYTNELTRPYAIDLFHYLLVKDGGQFKSGSFIRVMPNFMFEMILNSSGAAVNALKGSADNAFVKKTFGASINQLYNEFVRGFLQSSNTTFFTKTLKTNLAKNNEVKELKKKLDIPENTKIQSPITTTDTGIQINVFKNTTFERELIPLGDVSNYKGDEMIVDQNGNYQIVQPMVALPGESRLSDEGKKFYRYNLNYLRIAGLVQESKDGKTQIGFPIVLKTIDYTFNKKTFYRLKTIKRDRVKQEENLADLIQPGDMYAFGVSAEYEKFDPIGSRKQFAAGFVIPGSLPTFTGIFANRRNKNVANNPGAFSDLNNIDFDQSIDKQLANIDFSKAPANISSTLASNGITVKTEGKKITYEKDGKPFDTTAKSPEELAKTLTPKAQEQTEEFGDIDAMLASAPAAAFNVSMGAVLKAKAEYPVLNEFYMNELTDEQKEKIKQDLNITSFVNFVEQYKDYVNTSGGNQNSFVEQIKRCYL
jgi:hypothetical protein